MLSHVFLNNNNDDSKSNSNEKKLGQCCRYSTKSLYLPLEKQKEKEGRKRKKRRLVLKADTAFDL